MVPVAWPVARRVESGDWIWDELDRYYLMMIINPADTAMRDRLVGGPAAVAHALDMGRLRIRSRTEGLTKSTHMPQPCFPGPHSATFFRGGGAVSRSHTLTPPAPLVPA